MYKIFSFLFTKINDPFKRRILLPIISHFVPIQFKRPRCKLTRVRNDKSGHEMTCFGTNQPIKDTKSKMVLKKDLKRVRNDHVGYEITTAGTK